MDHGKLGLLRSAFRELDQRLLADIGYGTPEFEARITVVRRRNVVDYLTEMVTSAFPILMTAFAKVGRQRG
jgi:hypothetical protein